MTKEIKKKLKVLIVENNPVDRKMLSGMLSKSSYGSFSMKSADTLEEAFTFLKKESFDVILLDLNLQDSSGLDTLIKMHKKFPDHPIVVNTGVYQDALGLKAVTSGAQDYLIKGKYKSYGLSKSLYYAIERKKAEEELELAYIRLKEMQSQLIQVEKMNVVGGLASGVAHEVKNPLATIMYGVEFLNTKIKQEDKQINLTLQSIKEASRRANEIIKDLLDFASLSKLKCKEEDLNNVIDQSLILTKHQCDKSCIQVVKKFDKKLPQITIDKNRIEQVIVDVMLNSILAMKNGGILTIKTYSKKVSKVDSDIISQQTNAINKGDKVIVVDIDDTGPGIRDEHLIKIFDPFFTTRRAAGGVGLGLSIARTIMNNHEGCINLGNIKGGGTRAKLIFKAKEKRGRD